MSFRSGNKLEKIRDAERIAAGAVKGFYRAAGRPAPARLPDKHPATTRAIVMSFCARVPFILSAAFCAMTGFSLFKRLFAFCLSLFHRR
ncbi:hypothetical protein Bsp3421_005809 [Burkholderia sp. FERM BP-3421]|uniref:hypothetical protein n=1 Tax=Burkholderia sp. FERM BP-3421 TaxID=1494466 RepID=UPI002362A808|nr:hypothetical protein [Burkholderia sp. FERM BP-3421]WDD95633.1 hypothetical protein Bsp3421_005809 [Burkholderia sp. FERM BP-3421]